MSGHFNFIRILSFPIFFDSATFYLSLSDTCAKRHKGSTCQRFA